MPASTSLEWGADDNLTIELWIKPYDTSNMVAIGRRGHELGAGNNGAPIICITCIIFNMYNSF